MTARRWAPVAWILAGAAVLRLVAGVGFANYDTLYALAWGGQLSRGGTPAYDAAIAPTPHPLVELLGIVLAPLGAGTAVDVTVALGFIALSACTWLVYELGSVWVGRAAGALAALIFVTRVPVLSYGVRAYVDLPFLALLLGALLSESRSRSRDGRAAGPRVLALLAVAGLLRPEAWAFSGLYWLYLMDLVPARLRVAHWRERASGRGELVRATALAAAAPLVWLASDLAVTGDPLWSLTNTRHTATTLGRVKGIGNVPEYVPRRIGEILRPPVLAAAALGGVLTLLWLRPRVLLGAIAGLLAVIVFAVFASLGLPINTRYAFPAAAILCVFAGAGVFGWLALPPDEPQRRTPWMVAGAVLLIALAAYVPSQYKSAHRELANLERQQHIEDDLVALLHNRAITLRCGPVGVPNHAPVPLLALYLKTSPVNVINGQVARLTHGVYVDPASKAVEERYVLDPRDPHVPVSVPPGFTATRSNGSWLVFERC
jgi:hypothetical protein